MLAEDWRLGASYVDGWVESQDTRMDGYGWDALRVSRLSFLVWRRHDPVIRRGRWLGIRRLGRVYGCPALARRRVLCSSSTRLSQTCSFLSWGFWSRLACHVTGNAFESFYAMQCAFASIPSASASASASAPFRRRVPHIGARTDFFSRRGTDDAEPATSRKNSEMRTALLPFPRD